MTPSAQRCRARIRRIWIRHLVVVIRVHLQAVGDAPRVKPLATQGLDSAAWVRLILGIRGRDKDDLSCIQGGGGEAAQFIQRSVVPNASPSAVFGRCIISRGGWVAPVFGIKRTHRGDDLDEVVLRLGALRGILDALESREGETHQHRDDGDDDEQLDERKAAAAGGAGESKAGHASHVERSTFNVQRSIQTHFCICSGNGQCAQSELSCRQKSS